MEEPRQPQYPPSRRAETGKKLVWRAARRRRRVKGKALAARRRRRVKGKALTAQRPPQSRIRPGGFLEERRTFAPIQHFLENQSAALF